MSTNAETTQTWSYHDGTKHTPASVRTGGHVMDWTNQPRAWKLYTSDPPRVELLRQIRSAGIDALKAIAGGRRDDDPEMSLEAVSAVLLLSAGITKRLPLPSGSFMPFRAAACTGALYHIELYLVTGELPGLAAGVYQYGVHDNALRRLRDGDYRSVLARAADAEPAIGAARAVLVYTTTYWRNAWKYQDRAYRHAYWDSGTIIANMLAVAGARGLAPSVVTGFRDAAVNELVGVDPATEAAVALVPFGESVAPLPDAPSVEPMAWVAEPLSRDEIDFPAIRAMHEASSLVETDDVAAWRASGRPAAAPTVANTIALPAPAVTDRALEDVIVERGSSRRFDRTSIKLDQLSALLGAVGHRVPLDATAPDVAKLTDAYVIASAVDGLAPGTYRYLAGLHALEPITLGDPRAAAEHLALDQSLGGDAAFNVYFLADLPTLLSQLGNRAYRAAHLDASVAAGRMYLAAYALGLGASGLTFYDDEVTAYFGPSAAGKSVMFLIAVGRRATRASAP
jgi:SagB-type dehydrogenase family enzyme